MTTRNSQESAIHKNPKWWVDSYYTIHPDMKSHTGIFMTLGKEPCTQHLATKIENKEL